MGLIGRGLFGVIQNQTAHKNSGSAYFEEVLHRVGVVAVGESERRRLKLRNSRSDVASETEFVHVMVVEDSRHARRYYHDDSVTGCTQNTSLQSIDQRQYIIMKIFINTQP